MDLWGPLHLVLQSIQALQADSSQSFPDSEIARKARMPLANVRNCLIVLHENEFISLAMLTDGLSASLEAKGRTALTYPTNVPLMVWTAVKVMPKGLRHSRPATPTSSWTWCPARRNQSGLPESISDWKNRIEERDFRKTFQVGVIYGPSGCGKTSLVKAGLIPNLTDDLVVDVDVNSGEAETLLLENLRRTCEGLAEVELAQALSLLSQGTGLPEGKTNILIVIDQFEQFLHANRSNHGDKLVASLKNCDGTRVQALILVRDDFWMALTRFMAELGVEMRQDVNCAAIDLFGKRHAERVLTSLAALGALPDDTEELTDEQKKFLADAVTELAREEDDERVSPVRLSLFAQMLGEKEWSPSTLISVGGAEGVGVTFLADTFDSERGKRRYNIHQGDVRATSCILKALLPDLVTGIKGGMRSEDDLLKMSECEGDVVRFRRLIRILDSDTRLITPTQSKEESGIMPDSGNETVRSYQLTHDYLVPSIRRWLAMKQVETRRGRAELLLSDRLRLWTTKSENRFLPSVWEWARIRLLTNKKEWTHPQQRMMQTAGHVHLMRGLAIILALGATSIVALNTYRSFRATYLVEEIQTAGFGDLPRLIENLRGFRWWADGRLRRVLKESALDSDKYLHASLALLPVDDAQGTFIFGRLLAASPQQLIVARDFIHSRCEQAMHRMSPKLRDVLYDSQANAQKRLRAAGVLALFDSTGSDVNWPRCPNSSPIVW